MVFRTWDENDGLKSVVNGHLSSGLSGLSLMHSDIGGQLSPVTPSYPHLDLTPATYALYGTKYIGLVSLALRYRRPVILMKSIKGQLS